MSFFDLTNRVFDELNVLPIYRKDLLNAIKILVGEEFEYNNIKEIAQFNYNKMIGE
jgi:hypothetical protein